MPKKKRVVECDDNTKCLKAVHYDDKKNINFTFHWHVLNLFSLFIPIFPLKPC